MIVEIDSTEMKYVNQLGFWAAIVTTLLLVVAGITATAYISTLSKHKTVH